MANNIIIGNNIVMAIANSDMSIFSSGNTNIIRGISNGNYTSFQPGRDINSLSSIVAGQGYLLNSKSNRDLSSVFGLGGDSAQLLSQIITQIP